MRKALLAIAAAALGAATGCQAVGPVPLMGSARVTSDFETYAIERVGLVPFHSLEGLRLAAHEVGEVETTFHAEFVAGTSYDLVPLRREDLAEVLPIEPFRRGRYAPEAIRTLRDRYRLDAILVGTITSRRVMAPQVLGMQLDLVSCETGATIWSADLLLDASREDTRAAIEHWAERELGNEASAELALLAPQRFAHFAAFQMARLL